MIISYFYLFYVVDIKEILLTWSNLPKSIWKKSLAFNKLLDKLPAEHSQKSLDIIITLESRRFSSSSTCAFFLLCLEASVRKSKVIDNSELEKCLLSLLTRIDFSLARKIKIPNIIKHLSDSIHINWHSFDSLRLLHFFPFVKVDWIALSKFLYEIKSVSLLWNDLVPFLSNFLIKNSSNPDLINIIDRLARRNPIIAAGLFDQIIQSDSVSDCIDFYVSIFEVLVPSENEIVHKFVNKAPKIISLSPSLCKCLLLVFKTSSLKGKEFISKFLAECLLNDIENISGTDIPDFVDICSKEMSNELTLTYLIQCAALVNSNSDSFKSFLKTNLKSSQKLSIRSSILFGISKSGKFNCLNSEILAELFSPALLKESLQPTTPHSTFFFIGTLSALVNHHEFVPDAKLLDDILLALSKLSGPAVLCEKGWSLMDLVKCETILKHFILPSVFLLAEESAFLSYSISALAWFIINGSKESFKLIRKHLMPLSVHKADIFASALDKLLSIEVVTEFKAHRVWTALNYCCSKDTLNSRSLALLCHDKSKLLGLGAGSWAEIVRSQCTDIDSFCKEQFLNMIKLNELLDSSNKKTSSFYLLETLISLSPNLIQESISPLSDISKCIEDLLNFTPAQWSLIYTGNNKKPITLPSKSLSTSKSSVINPISPSIEDVATKESLLLAISAFKNQIALVRAVAQAIPFHSSFTDIRSRFIVLLLKFLEIFSTGDNDLNSIIIPSVYEIAAESLDGQGPLLVSLFLRTLNFHQDKIDASWNIIDINSLFDSVIKIITEHCDDTELILVTLVLSRALRLDKIGEVINLSRFKTLLQKLQALFEHCEAIESEFALSFVLQLLNISEFSDASIKSLIMSVLIEIGEIPNLEICNFKDLLNFNLFIRKSSPDCQLIALKFLTSFYASHSSAHSLLDCKDFNKTIWLLHFGTSDFEVKSEKNEELKDDEFHEESKSFFKTKSKSHEIFEVTTIASELCALLQLDNFDFDILSELMTLETEKGEKEFQVKNLLEHYITALSANIKSAKHLEDISKEFARLLSTRTIPNGIVRLTKNIDRSRLDFTKQTRKSILYAISMISSEIKSILISELVSFFFEIGFTDPDEENCELVFSSVIDLIEVCSSSESEALYTQLQNYHATVPVNNDRIKVYAVILLGRASSRLPSLTASPQRIWELIDRIQDSLNIPSERVQKSVADTLVPLLRSLKNDKRISTLTFAFATRLREAREDYGALRGVAFGLATLIESCGTGLIRSYDLFNLLLEGLGRLNKKGSEASVCSSLAAIEIIATRCGIAFEPYISTLVPGVLEALGDSRQRVREDAEACADAMMTALSPLSVALILPPLLEMAGMDGCDPRYSWRAKLGAVTWLGSMACLAPKVLTTALPKIIPALIVALTDAHEKVHLAAHNALAVKYAAIIRSPEIKAALPAVLRALSDPPRYASSCLGDIIGTSFCHAVDGPSLALLEPLLSRALRERGTGSMSEAKRRAILITANLGSLMDPAELRPYLDNLVPALRGVLGDAVPQVRSGASRALGVLMRLMHSNDLANDCPVLVSIVPECLEIIFSPLQSVSAIDRAGAAQAIAQVTASRGLEPLIELVNKQVAPVLFEKTPESLKTTTSAREALLHLCAALPSAVPLAQVAKLYENIFTRERIYAILQGCGDEDEGVREISTKTIRSLLLRSALFVDLQGALEIILKGTTDGRWRLRYTCFNILSDLLPILSMSTEVMLCDTPNRTLSVEMRGRVLSRLFFGRFDCNGLIRNVAFSLWKSIVNHPPRVILEILPILVEDCVASLEIDDEDGDEGEDEDEEDYSEYENETSDDGSDDSELSGSAPVSANVKLDRYDMASSALQDILVKLSDRVLLPFLQRLVHLFNVSREETLPGILLAARIVTSVIIVPNLTPLHQRNSSSVPVVSVPRAQIDEALKLVLQLTQQGLTADSDRTVRVAVGLFAKIAEGLDSSPALLERIISDLFFASSEDSYEISSSTSSDALIAVLNRRPLILISSLVNRFRKITTNISINWSWWSEVFEASGPYLGYYAPSLLTHLLKLLNDQAIEQISLVDALLASMASYNSELYYGDDANYENDEFDLDDAVENGLFSFGQVLETLWSARNLPALSAFLIERFASKGSNGIDRFYDIWIDRLIVASLTTGNDGDDSLVYAGALERIIERAIERNESLSVISQLNQSFDTRTIVSNNISSKLSSSLLLLIIKSLCLPVITDSSISSSNRFEGAQLFQRVLNNESGNENIKSLPSPAATGLLGSLIRCLSDRSDNLKTERLKSTLLPVLLNLLKTLPVVGKPFHPQLARLCVTLLKDLIVSVSLNGNSINLDIIHPRGHIALVTCQLVCLLLLQMSRVEVLLEEFCQFRDADKLFDDEISVRNSRRIILAVLEEVSKSNFGNLSSPTLKSFINETLKSFMILPNKEIDIIRETSVIGTVLADKMVDPELKTFINDLI